MISARALSVALACLLLVGLGAAGGVWLGARHYRPQLDAARSDLVACRAARDSLDAAVAEQDRQVTALRQAGEQRAREAALAVEQARQRADGSMPRRSAYCWSAPSASSARPPRRLSIRRWGYEGGADVDGDRTGGMRRPGRA